MSGDRSETLAVIDNAAQAAAALDPLRNKILAQLVEPGSASTVAKALGTTRQKVNYHLGVLEQVGLVELVEERPRRGLIERIMVTSARSYLLSPEVLGPVAASPESATDGADHGHLSAQYLLAVAGRIIREVAGLRGRGGLQKPSPSTLTIDTQIRFASTQDRADFTADLANAVAALTARYHNESAPNGRWHRLIVAAYRTPPEAIPETEETARTNHESIE